MEGWSEPGVSPSPAKIVVGRDSYTELKKTLPPAPQVPDSGWGQGKAGTCAIEIKMVQEEILDQRGLSV